MVHAIEVRTGFQTAAIGGTHDAPRAIDTILLYDRPNTTDHVTAGTITFDDGTSIDVGEIPNDGFQPVELNFTPKTIRSLRFTITSVSATTQNAGIAEIAVYAPASN